MHIYICKINWKKSLDTNGNGSLEKIGWSFNESEIYAFQYFAFQFSKYFTYRNNTIKANRKWKQAIKLSIKIQNNPTAEHIKMIKEILHVTQ